jgi:PAS domain S-box-containing protein
VTVLVKDNRRRALPSDAARLTVAGGAITAPVPAPGSAAPSGTWSSTAADDAVHAPIYRRADRGVGWIVVAHLVLSAALAPVYGTWGAAAAVGATSALGFALSIWLAPGSLWTRYAAGITLQAFCALHIYQMDGLAEMHFFFFTSVTALIIYKDARALWPGVWLIIAQHTVFSYFHNADAHFGGRRFFEPHHVSVSKLAFHFGIALAQVAIASYCATALRRRTLADAAHRATLEEANARLAAQAEELERANVLLVQQAATLAGANDQLQDQAMELEAQAEELQAINEDIAVRSDALAAAMEALGSSESKLRRIADAGIVGLFYWDVAGGITQANHAFLSMLGYTQDDLAAGRVDWRRLTPPEFAEADAEKVAELVATGSHGAYEKTYYHKDGHAVPVMVASAFFEQSTERGVCICVDASDRARLLAAERAARREAELARAHAEQANAAKARFLATMSHELRTPLNAIGGYAELLEMGIQGPVTDGQQDYLSRVRRAQQRLLALIDDVLSFAKLEAGRMEFQTASVDVRALLAETEALVAPQIAARGVDYRPQLCDGLVARADARKVQQVVLNLLSNAVKFSDPGATLTLSARAEGEQVLVAVADTGRGIPPEQCEAIFSPFVQVDASLTRPAQGTGLGLAISRELARGMGGELTVESEVGVGSTFTLMLPRG